jgi:hypothetical protein
MAEEEATDRKDGIERRAYNLPANLLARLRAYQLAQGISSETEAARRLLDYALQMRDSVMDILQSLRAKFDEEKDLRVLASDILTRHILVTDIGFEDDSVWFRLKNGERGRLDTSGRRFTGQGYGNDDWSQVRDAPPLTKPLKTGGPSWDAPSSDLDGEIPF